MCGKSFVLEMPLKLLMMKFIPYCNGKLNPSSSTPLSLNLFLRHVTGGQNDFYN